MVPVHGGAGKARRLLFSREVFEAVAELGESFYDDAMQLCDDEREAAAWASATLVQTLLREKVLGRAAPAPAPEPAPVAAPAAPPPLPVTGPKRAA